MITQNIIFLIILQIVMFVYPLQAAELLEKYSHTVISMTPKHTLESLKRLELPITLRESDAPFSEEMHQGKVVNIYLLKSQHIPTRNRKPWICVGRKGDESFEKLDSRANTKDVIGHIIIVPFMPFNIHLALVEHQKFHMKLTELIENFTDPDFFEIFFQGLSLNMFIFPTLHTLSFGALHSGLRNFIQVIANEENAQLVTEILAEKDDNEESDDETEAAFKDPRKQLNIEKCIQRDLAAYTQTCRDSYPDDAEWTRRLQEEAEVLRNTYLGGWTKKLSLESQNRLTIIAGYMKKTLTDLDKLDPYYVYLGILDVCFVAKESLKSTKHVQLDHRIIDIFTTQGKSIKALEVEDDRYEAKVAENTNRLQAPTPELYIIAHLMNHSLYEIPKEVFQPRNAANLTDLYNYTIHTPTLEDIDFSDPLVCSYLKGRSKFIPSVSANERNIMWWKGKTLQPVLLERAAAISHQHPFPPHLTIYGIAHNFGPYAIIKLIETNPGFEVKRTRPNVMTTQNILGSMHLINKDIEG